MLKFLLIVLILGYVFSRVIGPVLRFLLKRHITNMQGNGGESRQTSEESKQRRKRAEGTITIDHIPRKKRNGKSKRKVDEEGEYVDYEEL